MPRRALLVLLLATACNDPTSTAQAAGLEAPVPKAAPVGRLAASGGGSPPVAAAAEPRGIVGPKGALGPDVYRRRRRKLMEQIGGTGGVLVAQEAVWRGARDGMDFYYLTGIEGEAGAFLFLRPRAPTWKESLFLKPRDVEAERWDGERAPLPGKAVEVATGIARVRRTNDLGRSLLEACEHDKELVYVGDFVTYTQEVPVVLDIYRKATARTLGCSIRDAHGTLTRMRVVKEPEELVLMRKAIDATAEGHTAAVRAIRPGAREYEVKQAIEDGFRRAGSRHVAFDSIVGSGPNAAVLHYPYDDRAMRDGELVVVDIGAEWEFYAADVTRTYPVSGRYSPEQREIYDVVLRAQQAGIAAAKKGATIEEIDQVTRRVIEEAGYYDHYLHFCCHYVGLEVHDVGDANAPLGAGAVITVEPGIYLPHAGFGVRIEDEVLITDGAPEVLSRHIPKDPEEIERLMAEARK